MEILIVVLLLILIYRTRSPFDRLVAFAMLSERLAVIEGLLKQVPASEIEALQMQREEAFLLKFKAAPWRYRLNRPTL
jgi:hypothetical protein